MCYSKVVYIAASGMLLCTTANASVIHVPADQPTIQAGIDAASNGDTVSVAPGNYTEDDTIQGKDIVIMSEKDADSTIITGSVTYLNSETTPTLGEFKGFSVVGLGSGVGITIQGSSPTIKNCIVSSWSYGIYSTIDWSTTLGSSPTICYNLVIDNGADGIQVAEAGNPKVYNNTVAMNGNYGIIFGFVDADIRNNIIYHNAMGIGPFGDLMSTVIDYNDVYGNDTNYVDVTPSIHCISQDPFFIGGDPFNYHLTASSPCIDAGDPDPQYNDPDGTRNDIGAYYYDQTGIEDENNELTIPKSPFLHQNSPNPAYSVTRISFGVPKDVRVLLNIYDITGRPVCTLVNGIVKAGYHTINWDCRDANGRKVASGIYFYRFEAGNFNDTKKLILLR